MAIAIDRIVFYDVMKRDASIKETSKRTRTFD
jgi:hypothetical protein